MLCPRDEVQQLGSERPAVEQAHLVLGELPVLLQILHRAHAEPLVAQNDIADAEYGHRRNGYNRLLHQRTSFPAFFAATCARSHAYQSASPSPV